MLTQPLPADLHAPEHDGLGALHHSSHAEPKDAPADLWAQATETLDLQGRMERQPYQTLLVAAGIGFLASGALFSRFTLRVMGLAMRVVVLPALETQAEAATRVHRAAA